MEKFKWLKRDILPKHALHLESCKFNIVKRIRVGPDSRFRLGLPDGLG